MFLATLTLKLKGLNKKSWYAFFIAILCTGFLHAHCLVFVHIGPQLPDYLPYCITQARLFNPSTAFYLLANKQALQDAPYLKQQNVQCITLEALPKTKIHRDFLERTAFQPGFWRYASERFLYIHDFMATRCMENVYHIENDVMLYADLTEMHPLILQRYPGIAAVFDSDYRCIPSFMFIPNTQVMEKLAEAFAVHSSQHKNDMDIIALFKQGTNAQTINNLPIIMDPYIAEYGLRNDRGHTPAESRQYSQNIDAFKSIFDGAALGQYLGGIHSDVTRKGFINETTVFNPSHFKYSWICDAQGRRIPHAEFKGTKYRINNLHIHSKQLDKFMSR